MNLSYKIIEVWPQDHLIVVRYFTDRFSEMDLAVDANLLDAHGSPKRCRSDVSIQLPVPSPKGEELHKLIVANAPFEWFKTMEAIADPEVDTTMSDVHKMVGKVYTKEVTGMIKDGVNALSDADIEKLIETITSGKTGNASVT